MSCPFCQVSASRMVLSAPFGYAFRDGYPISEGHTLVVPRRHLVSIFDALPEEQAALWCLVGQVREQLATQLHPDGFNIGVNDGQAAGQTIGHGHIHVIPRWRGDVQDPRGGVRWLIPAKADYWSER